MHDTASRPVVLACDHCRAETDPTRPVERLFPRSRRPWRAPRLGDAGTRRQNRPPENARPVVLAGDGFAFVSHTGEIRSSAFFPASAGNVLGKSLVEAYRESGLFTSLRDRSSLGGKCGASEYRRDCGGSRSRAFVHTGDPTASDPLCPSVPGGYDGPLPGPAHPNATDAGGVEGSAD